MHTRQVDKDHTPELFYEPRILTSGTITAWSAGSYVIDNVVSHNNKYWNCIADTTDEPTDESVNWVIVKPQFDEAGDATIYDRDYTEPSVATGAKLKRRVEGGGQSVHLEPAIISYYYDTGAGEELICTSEIIPQYLSGTWQDFTKKLDDYIAVVDGHLLGEGVQGAFSWNIDISFDRWQVVVVAPSFTVRIKWVITFSALGQQLMAEGKMKFGMDDITNPYTDDEGVAVRTIIIEPDGSVDGITVGV